MSVLYLFVLQVSSYRFSFSWPRIMPDGTNESVSNAGVNYYHKVLDGLLAKNITPQVSTIILKS